MDLYEKILKDYKETFKTTLEIGIYFGGSIQLWNDYFTNATVIGVDICTKETYLSYPQHSTKILNNNKVSLLFETNAYNHNFIAFLKFSLLILKGKQDHSAAVGRDLGFYGLASHTNQLCIFAAVCAEWVTPGCAAC